MKLLSAVAILLALTTAGAPAATPTCRITGDSIGVMVASVKSLKCSAVICGVKQDRPDCSVKGAMDTRWILRHVKPSDVAVISAASNDIKDWHPRKNGKPNPDRQILADRKRTDANLEAIRAATKATRVIWIKPLLREPGEAVAAIAERHGDAIVSYTVSNDGVHPAKPAQVAAAIGGAIVAPNAPAANVPAPKPRPTKAVCQERAKAMKFGIHWLKRHRFVRACMAGEA